MHLHNIFSLFLNKIFTLLFWVFNS